MHDPSSAKKIAPWNDILGPRLHLLHHHQPAEHDSVELIKMWQRKLQSKGDYLDQTYAYLDSQSGLDWLNFSNHGQYGTWGGGLPCQWAARAIKSHLKANRKIPLNGLEVVALACGDGRKEAQITDALLEVFPQHHRLLFELQDINSQLLDHAFKHATTLFQDEPRVKVLSVLSDMYKLNTYTDFFCKSEEDTVPYLLLLLGNTIGNLTDEILFLKDSLSAFPRGTMLLLDFTLAFGSADNHVELMEKEPYFSKTSPPKWSKALERFYLGPFRRHKQGVKEVLARSALDTSRARVPGSYSIELYADLIMEDGSQQSFDVHRIKRYQSEMLIDTIEENTDWKAICGKRVTNYRELFLFAKQ